MTDNEKWEVYKMYLLNWVLNNKKGKPLSFEDYFADYEEGQR